MCSFITQHNATDVASFEGACNWHADCRNVHQSCCPWIECSFLYHKPSPKAFQRIWQYIQPASQPQTTCNHTSPGPPHPASSPPRSSETRYCDEILRPIVVPFIHDHHLMLQHDNARPQGSVHWKLKHPSSCMASILTGQICKAFAIWCWGTLFLSIPQSFYAIFHRLERLCPSLLLRDSASLIHPFNSYTCYIPDVN